MTNLAVAENIRNKSTKISRAVAQLDSLYRWALTGTPITNQLGDGTSSWQYSIRSSLRLHTVFPLLRFLQIKPFYAWADFRNHVVVHEKKRPDLAGCKTQAILRTCLLRRKKDSKLDGKELITLCVLPQIVSVDLLIVRRLQARPRRLSCAFSSLPTRRGRSVGSSQGARSTCGETDLALQTRSSRRGRRCGNVFVCSSSTANCLCFRRLRSTSTCARGPSFATLPTFVLLHPPSRSTD